MLFSILTHKIPSEKVKSKSYDCRTHFVRLPYDSVDRLESTQIFARLSYDIMAGPKGVQEMSHSGSTNVVVLHIVVLL